MTYTVAFYRYNQVQFTGEQFATEGEARNAAIALDGRLGKGDRGIAFIIAEDSHQMAYVGNGCLQIDDDEYGKALEWQSLSLTAQEALAFRDKLKGE